MIKIINCSNISNYLCDDLKYTLVILLFTALLAQTFSRSLAMADYLVNLETYKKNCVNKAKPKLNCNGKCQVYKKINKQENSSNAETQAPKFNLTEPVLSSKSFFPILTILATNNASSYFNFSDDFSSNYIGAIFHPPGA